MKHKSLFRLAKSFSVAFLITLFSGVSAIAQSSDPSALRDPQFGDLPEGLEEANQGAFEGGFTESSDDAAVENSISKENQREKGLFFNIPTNGAPSPLFGAEPFTQQFLRFEEFGYQQFNFSQLGYGFGNKLPQPPDAQSIPGNTELDVFLSGLLFPLPTRESNTAHTNPWESAIEDYLGRDLIHPPAEGRPPGEGWAHQRWDEFHPKKFFKTVQTGARTNGGIRDWKQRHRYVSGEFGPGGLYHNTTGNEGFDGTTHGIEVRFHPNMPIQDPLALWTFDGTFPPKLLMARYGEPLIMRHYNALPIDVSANRGFGLHTISTHEHNGHNPAESDGYTNAFFFPGQFYDYRWPMTLAGTDTINVTASDPKAGMPTDDGGIENIKGDWHETMSTHWFHDHMLDFTAQNVYKGNAAMMNYYSSLDRGNEAIDDGVNLRLPSGTALPWGNRDYDVNLLIAEKAWDQEGQLWFNPFNQTGFIGDVMTVNWLYKPYMDVRARKYRFRILNGSVSRFFKIALVTESGAPVPFYMVANDGNIMEHTVYFENGELPTQGIAERYDIIVDFSHFQPGQKLYFVNVLQQRTGQSVDRNIPMQEIISGAYKAVQVDDDGDGIADRWFNDPVVGKFMEFRIHEYTGVDLSMNPADYVEGKNKMIPLQRPAQAELDKALHRTFEFERKPTDDAPWVIETDGGKAFNMDPRRLTAAPKKNSGDFEVWSLLNSGTWSHPVHIHFEEGIVLRRDGVEPPPWEYWARKDVYRIGPADDSSKSIQIALRFREFAGTFMEHCHNTQHEDHAMLMRWDVENPGQVKMMPAPIPSWDGVSYVDTVALPTARSGDAVGEFGPNLDSQAVNLWIRGSEVSGIDLVNMKIGSALDPEEDERGSIKIPLRKGVNIDNQGNERDVYFVLHDISDEKLADELGVAWAGGLEGTPEAATSQATVSESGVFTFYGDLPNPITHPAGNNDPNIPAQSSENNYSPLRRVNIAGKDVIVNAFFVQWGNESWEHLGIDNNCSFPDDPPNTNCMYNGQVWGGNTGHTLEINTNASQPYARFKIHKSWSEGGDYNPYYIVVDSYPAGPANNMSVIYVPKHEFLADSAVPLVQFLPGHRLNSSYPPTPDDEMGLMGGGPLGGQIGVPSYFMPEDDYSPLWHIGFAHWLEPATGVVKSINELKGLRELGKVEIHEWPAIRVGENDYDFENLNSPHVVNCPTPVTIDFVLHEINKDMKAAKAAQNAANN